MEFQILSLSSGDEGEGDGKEFIVKCFGRTSEDETICLDIPYKPFFYIEHTQGMQFLKHDIEEKTKASSMKKVESEKFYGFQNYKLYQFYKLSFDTKMRYYYAQKVLQNAEFGKHNIYEGNVDPMLKLIHEKHLDTTGWVKVNKYEIVSSDYKVKRHIRANISDIEKLEKNDIASFVVASFDIESYSPDGSFPDPRNIDCPVIQIATTFQRIGEEQPFKKVLLNLKSCDPIEGVELHTFEDEKDLLEYWPKVLHENEYDCMTGYNIWGFDLWYMYTRAELLDATKFKQLGKTDEESAIKENSFSSSAYGHSDYKMVSSPGIFQLDLLVVIKREHKLNSYKLDSVSEHFLGDKKVDLSPKEMFAKFRGSSSDRKDIGVYCVKDTDLPLRLIWKLAIFLNMIEMAKVTKVPINFLIERGQGIKVFSQICYEAHQSNMIIETFQKAKVSIEEAAYEGATVLEAKKGAYMNEPITGLDFASLYPSIERAWNLCPTTLVVEPKFRNVEGEKYVKIDKYLFSQNRQGIVPKLLERLAKSRKQAKKDMANAENAFMKAVYNGKQLAFKVSMNSIYGAMGSPTFQIPCKPVAESTTRKGREMIDQTKSLVEEYYPGAEVVYGDTDSVMVKFPTTSIEESFRLGEEAAERISKTFPSPVELEFEKVYNPYLLFSKKRYAGLMYTKPEKPDYIDAKGIQLVRRDNCAMVRKILKETLDIIMYEKNIEKAKDLVKQKVIDLENNKVDVNDLVVSKSLKKIKYSYENNILSVQSEYKNPQPHVQVAENIERREKGTGPKSGERVPYVFIDTGRQDDLQYQKAEDPEYVIEKKLRIDVAYYKERALINPIESLFELFYDNPIEEIFIAVEKAKQAILEDFYV